MPRVLTFTVDVQFNEHKLCAFLRGGAQLSYALCATLRHTPGAVTRGNDPIRMIDRVHTGETISVRLPQEPTTLAAAAIPIDVLYADEDLLIVNKSGYIAMHPAHMHPDDTLANAVTYYLRENRIEGVFHAVGRLDKGTSGAAVCALHSFAASRMAQNVQKTYVALVDAELSGSETVDVPIYRPDPEKTERACGERGERAVTHYTVLYTAGGKSLVRLRLDTGRTHQIRVHMAHIGAPLTGDSLYGNAIPSLGRHLLHCERVRFTHPVTGTTVCIDAPLPTEFCESVRIYMGADAQQIVNESKQKH